MPILDSWEVSIIGQTLEVENELGKKIKTIKSDYEGEYYGKYDGSSEQRLRPFARYLHECGIVPQYTMLWTLG